jgi:hypothetical protein
MKKLIKKILKESNGISFDVREWTDIIHNEIISTSNRDRLIIDGYDHYETYKKFGIDYLVIDFYDKVTGYDPKKSGYDKDGYYVVLLYIQPQIVDGQTQFNLKTTLNHELKHAYQDFKRQSKGHSNIDNTKESKEFYTDDFIGLLNSREMEGSIKTILKYYYYLSNLERDAYLENVYDGNQEYEKIVRKVLATDFSDFKFRTDGSTTDDDWEYINKLDIPLLKKFSDSNEFVDYSGNRLNNQAEKIIKKINKLKYVHGLNESEFEWVENVPDWREDYIILTENVTKFLDYMTKRVWGNSFGVNNFIYTMGNILRFEYKNMNKEYPLHYHTQVVEPFVSMVNDVIKLADHRSDCLRKNHYQCKDERKSTYLEFRTHRRLILNYIDESIHELAGVPEPRLNSLKKLLRRFK